MRRTLLAILLILYAGPAAAAAAFGGFAAIGGGGGDDPAALCEAAARRAAREEGVPLKVMRALALTETGRRRDGAYLPWAWTVNMEGAGRWFDDHASALAWVRERHAQGARSYDVGCFQINRRWHGHAFPSLEAMFDPDRNAQYAARFLRELHAETGSWARAVGYYHSRTPELAQRYRGRFERILAGLGAAPEPPPPPPRRPRAPGGPLIALAAAAGAPAPRGGLIPSALIAGTGGLLRAARPLFD
jgi:hypothetical protein